jgi:hypothetical protein
MTGSEAGGAEPIAVMTYFQILLQYLSRAHE